MPPNIIVCLCDQLRAHEVGCYGQPRVRTPRIDGLAAQGVRCEHAVTPNPVCMAARASLLSGQYSRTCNGHLGNTFWPRRDGGVIMPLWPANGRTQVPEATVAERLRDAGYATAAIGKWHIEAWPDQLGFDTYLIPRVQHTNSGQLYTRDGGRPIAAEGFAVDWELAQVREHLRRASHGDRPFFLYYNISPPHMPLADAPERYLGMYDPATIALRANVPSAPLKDQERWFHIYLWDYQFYRDAMPYTRELPPGFDLRALVALYHGSTTWVDDAVGGLLGALDDLNMAEDTIILFSADHGDQLGSHGLFNKGVLYEESIRIPMLWRWPRRLLPRTVDQQVCSLLDVAPTLCAFAGIEPPAHMQGQDLSAVLRGEAPSAARPYAIIETSGNGAAVRRADRVYGRPWADGSARAFGAGEPFHFDLLDDPHQLRRLGQSDAESEEILRAWIEGTPWMQPAQPAA
jgi:arylsulfatase A-like enzyme